MSKEMRGLSDSHFSLLLLLLLLLLLPPLPPPTSSGDANTEISLFLFHVFFFSLTLLYFCPIKAEGEGVGGEG